MVIQIFIWSLFIQLGSSTFFNIPGNPNKPIYSDETHEDLLRQLAGKRDLVELGEADFNIKDALSGGITFQEYSAIDITEKKEDGVLVSYELKLSGSDKPPIQRVINKMFGPGYNLQSTTTLLDGNEILFEGGSISREGIVTLLGSHAKCTFNREIKLTDLNYAFSWQDRLNIDSGVLGGATGLFSMAKLAIVLKAKSEVNGDPIDVDIEKPNNEEEKFTIKKYDPVDKTGSIKIFEDFLEFFYPDIEPVDMVTELDHVDPRKLKQINYDEKYKGFGWLSTDGSYQLCLQSKDPVESVAAFDGAKVNMKMIIHRVSNEKVNLAFIGKFDVADKDIKDVVSYITTNREEKLFDRIKDKDYCLSMSSEEFNIIVSDPSLDRYAESFQDCYPVEFEEGTTELKVYQGIATFIKLGLSDEHECIQEACREESCQQQYKESTVIGQLTRTGISWSNSKSNKIDMFAFIKCISNNQINLLGIPLDFLNPSKDQFLSIREFYQRAGYTSVTFEFSVLPNTIPLVIIPFFNVKTIWLQFERIDESVEDEGDGEEEADEEGGDEESEEAGEEKKSKLSNSTLVRKSNGKMKTKRTRSRKKQSSTTSKSGNTTTSSGSSTSSSNNNSNTSNDDNGSADSESDGAEEEEGGSVKYEASLTIDGEGGSGEQKNIFCKGDMFKRPPEFTCTLYIASMTIKNSLVDLMGETNAQKIIEDPAIVRTGILETGLKNIEASYSTINTHKFSLVAQISLGTFDKIFIECLYYQNYGVAFALFAKEINVEYIVQKFFGFDISLAWLRNLDAFVVVSSVKLEELKEAEGANDEGSEEESSEEDESSEEAGEEESRRHLNQQMNTMNEKSKNVLQSKRKAWLKTLACHAQKLKSGRECEKLTNNAINEEKRSIDKKNILSKKAFKQKAYGRVIGGRTSGGSKKRGSKFESKKKGNKQKSSGNNNNNTNYNNNKDESSSNDASESNEEESEEESEEEEESDDEEEPPQDPRYQFTISSIKHVPIGAGFQFGFKWKAPSSPEDCYEDSICKFIVANTNRAQLRIGGGYSVENGTLFFYADLRINVNLNEAKTMKLQGAQLQIRLSANPDETFILLSATLTYITNETNLIFKGVISAALSGKLELQFTMKRFVYEPLGIKYFAFGDLYLGAKISVEKGQFSVTIEVGVTIGIGEIIKEEGELPHFGDNHITITGFCGIDPVTLINSWVFAEMTHLTFGMIAQAFGQTFPENFKDDGFHKGLLFSYTNNPVTIHALNKKIESGVHFSGGVKFAFLEATGDFKFDHQKGILNIVIDFEPINLLGGLVVFTSKDDEEKGPHLDVEANIRKFKDTSFNIDARLTLFGISIGVKIEFEDKRLFIAADITILFFTAGLELYTAFNTELPAGFTVKLKLTSDKADFVEKLKLWLQESITGIENDARQVETRGNATRDKVEGEKTTADSTKSNWTTSINDWNKDLDDKKKELEEQAAQSAARYIRCKGFCDDICIPFFKWEPECWKVWGHWIGCPKWDSCYTKIKDPVCLLTCEVEYLKNSFLEFVQGAINKLEKAMTVVVNGLRDLVQAFNDALTALSQAVTRLLDFVKQLVGNILLKIITAIDLDIRYLELDADVRFGFRKCFKYGYDLTIFGTEHQYPPPGSTTRTEKVCLDEILRYFVKKLFGIPTKLRDHNKYYDEKDKADGMVESVNEAESEVNKQKTKTDRQIETERSREVVKKVNRNRRLPDRHFFKHVEDLKKKYHKEYAEEDLKVLNTPHRMKPYVKPAHLVKFIEEKAPWKMAQNIIDNPPNHGAIMATNQTHVKRSLIFGKHLSPCDRVKRSLKDYATLTNGLLQSIQHMEHAKVAMKNQKRDDINRLAAMYTKTHNLANEYENYTPRQKRDIYYWYEHLRDGYQEHFRLTKRSYLEHQRDTLPKVKDSLDGLLGKNLGSSFESYTDELHRHAIDGFKRSNIPKPNDGESLLHGIKRNLTLIVTNEEFPLTHMKRHLLNVNQAIRDVNKHVMQC